MLDAVGFHRDNVVQRTERIHSNTLRLARFIRARQGQYPGIEIIYPGIDNHPDHNVAADNYQDFGPFFFFSVGSPEGNAAFDGVLQRKMAERGVISYVRDSYGFHHFSSAQYFDNVYRRYALGEEDEIQMKALEECFDEALQEFFRESRGPPGTATDASMKAQKGGIDLTADRMALDVQNSGDGIEFHMDPAMLRQLQNLSGFSPVIINIQPLDSLPNFLGVKQDAFEKELALK